MPKKTKHYYKARERVRLRFGGHVLAATVVKNLGEIGVGGEQLVRIKVPLESTWPQVFEVTAGMLTPVSSHRIAAGPKRMKHRYKVGDRVRLRFGAHMVTATVVEDCGGIGIGGRQLVSVRVPLESTCPIVFVAAAEMLTPAPRRRVAALSSAARRPRRVPP
jgi:hypothetical protein